MIKMICGLSGIGAVCMVISGGCMHKSINPTNASTGCMSLEGKRMAFLGDSITDGHTLPILFEQSLKAAGITYVSPLAT